MLISCRFRVRIAAGILLLSTPLLRVSTGDPVTGNFVRHQVTIWYSGLLQHSERVDFNMTSPTGRIDITRTADYPSIAQLVDLTLDITTQSNTSPVVWLYDDIIPMSILFQTAVSGNWQINADVAEVIKANGTGTFDRVKTRLSAVAGVETYGGYFGKIDDYQYFRPPALGDNVMASRLDFITQQLDRVAPDSNLAYLDQSWRMNLGNWLGVQVFIRTYFEFPLELWEDPHVDGVSIASGRPRTGLLKAGQPQDFSADVSYFLSSVTNGVLQLEIRDPSETVLGRSAPLNVSGYRITQQAALSIPAFSLSPSLTEVSMVAMLSNSNGQALVESYPHNYRVYDPTDSVAITRSFPKENAILYEDTRHTFSASLDYSLQTREAAYLALGLFAASSNLIEISTVLVSESTATSFSDLQLPTIPFLSGTNSVIPAGYSGTPLQMVAMLLDVDTREPFLVSDPVTLQLRKVPEDILVTYVSQSGQYAPILISSRSRTTLELTAGTRLRYSDIIISLADTEVTLELPFGSHIDIDFDSNDRLELQSILKGANELDILFLLTSGRLDAIINPSGGNSVDVAVRTPRATIHAEGTRFFVSHTNGPMPSTTTQLISGSTRVVPESPFLPTVLPVLNTPLVITWDEVAGDYSVTSQLPDMPGYHVTRFARVPDPGTLTFGPNGDLYALSRYSGKIFRITEAGEAQAYTNLWFEPNGWQGFAFDAQTNVLVAHSAGTEILCLQSTNPVAVYSQGVDAPGPLAFAPSGHLYAPGLGDATMYRIDPDGSAHRYGTPVWRPVGLAVSDEGALYSCDGGYRRIFKAIPWTGAEIVVDFDFEPGCMTWDGSNTFYVGAIDEAHAGNIYSVTTGGVVTAIGGGFTQPTSIARNGAGILYIGDRKEDVIYRAAPYGSTPPQASAFPAELSLGEVIVGSYRDAAVRLQNRGDSMLNVTSATSSASEYNVIRPSSPWVLGPGETTNLTVRFSPGALGVLPGTLNLASDDPLHPVLGIPLTGTGVGTSYAATLPSGGVGWWPLDTNTHERLSGTPSIFLDAPSHVAGEVNNGLLLDGAGNGLEIPAGYVSNLDFSAGFTFEAWTRAEDVDVLPIVELDVYLNESFPEYPAIEIYLLGTVGEGLPKDLWARVLSDAGSFRFFNIPSAVLPEQFQHIALSMNSELGEVRIYVNGTKVEHNALTGAFSALPPCVMWLGQSSPVGALASRSFNGILDELTLYNRALTDEEVRGIYLAGTHGKDFDRPKMNIWTLTPNQMKLQWPERFSGVRVQLKQDLMNSTPWTDLPTTPILIDGHYEIDINTTMDRGYYRLVYDLVIP